MKQYICDRCGEIIPLYSDTYNHVLFYDKDVQNAHVQYQFNSKYNECDLCDECLEYLHNINQAFMEEDELVVK